MVFPRCRSNLCQTRVTKPTASEEFPISCSTGILRQRWWPSDILRVRSEANDSQSETRICLVLLGQLACLRTRIVRNWPCRQPLTHIRILGSQIKPKINIKSKTNKGHTKSKFRWKFTDAEGSLNNHLVRQWLSSNFAANSQSKFWQITTPSNEARRWNFSPFSQNKQT
jgi:hypothetical protein